MQKEIGIPKLVTAKAGGAANSSQAPASCAGVKETSLDLSGLKALLDGLGRGGERRLVDDVAARLFVLAAGEGSPAKVLQALEALTGGIGAKYAAWLHIEDGGARVVGETTAGRRRWSGVPAVVMAAGDSQIGLSAGSQCGQLSCDGALWNWVRHTDGFALLAAFEEGDEEGSEAFKECGEATAEFLRRCSQAEGGAGGGEPISSALVSLVHDMRNLVTGLTLCLGAYSENRRAARNMPAEEIGILDGQVSSLAAMCREFDLIRLAARLDEMPHSQGLSLDAFAALASGFGIQVHSGAEGQFIKTSTTARGILSRALVYVILGMLELKATNLELGVRRDHGRSSITIGFVSRFGADTQMSNETLRHACELVNARGGRAEICSGGGRTAVEMEFAPVSAMNG